MRRALMFSAVAVVLALPVWAGETEGPAAFKRLKSLEGEWKGKTAKGKPATLSYKVIAGGHTVMEVFSFGETAGPQSMYTLYHLDGDQLVLTHYCISNNQPRMRAQFPLEDPNVLRFAFLDSTNLKDPAAGHMHKAMLRFIDADHIANEWTYRQGGKDAYAEAVQYERVK